MAKISAFKTNSKAINEGEWIRVGDEYEDLEIHTRGFTDAYYDAQARRQRRAAIPLNGDVSKLTNAQKRAINTEVLIEHVVLGVRNLAHDDGREVTFAEFQDMLRDPDYAELLLACYRAAGQVGQRRAADLEEAVGN
jgi:hypothetical protein